jgi:uncharacterized membrane protein
MNFIISFIITYIIFTIVDILWITFNYNYYTTLCKKIQKEPFFPKIPSIIIAYIILGIALYLYLKFISIEIKKKNYLTTILYGLLFGLAIYGTYSFTSCSYYKNYGYYDALIDTFWGIILFMISGIIFVSIYK